MFFHISERRQAEAARIREKYPDRIPVRLLYRLFGCIVFSWSTLIQMRQLHAGDCGES